MADYIPAKGDIVILTFDPQAGHEQQGRRPGIVLSNHSFNKATGLAIACPITNTNRGIPFHLVLPPSSTLTGYVMVEQVKSIDFRARQAKFVEEASPSFIEDVTNLLGVCF